MNEKEIELAYSLAVGTNLWIFLNYLFSYLWSNLFTEDSSRNFLHSRFSTLINVGELSYFRYWMTAKPSEMIGDDRRWSEMPVEEANWMHQSVFWETASLWEFRSMIKISLVPSNDRSVLWDIPEILNFLKSAMLDIGNELFRYVTFFWHHAIIYWTNMHQNMLHHNLDRKYWIYPQWHEKFKKL